MASTNQIRTKGKRKSVEYGRYGYLFIAPFFIVYALFQLYPLVYTIWMSFMECYSRGLKEVGPNFAGLQNFVNVIVTTAKDGAPVKGAKLFDTFTFSSLYNTIIMWLLNFVPQILLSLVLAAWFTDVKAKVKGQGAYKVIIFMPNIITAATIAVLFYSLFAVGGPVTLLLQDMGVVGEKCNFMESKTATRLIIAFIQFWMWYGNTMIVLIAGILGINPSLFEAAMVDGASGKQIFRYITLPLLKPITLFVLITSAIGGLQMYDIPSLFNVNNAGDALPDYASQTITMYIRSLTMKSKDYGKAAAASMVLFAVTLVISMLFFFFMGDRDIDTSKKKKNRKKGA